MPMLYTENFHRYKNNFQMKNFSIFFIIFAQNLDCGSEAVLTSTHNVCIRAKKKRNNEYHCKPQYYYIKVGRKTVYITRMCNPDASYVS